MGRIKLSKNFYLDEFERSETAARFGISNKVRVGSREYRSICELVQNIMQPLRDELGLVTVSSGYRGSLLNLKISGSDNSQHTKGEAVDFTVAGYTPFEVCHWISSNLPRGFDQLIHEFKQWAHVSHSFAGAQRCNVLTARRVNGETIYSPGLIDL